MTVQALLFYALAALLVGTTGLALTRRNLVHAVVYLALSFIATGLLFYLLGSPFLAALEVVIYSGAIMVLFLFVIVATSTESAKEVLLPLGQWVPAAGFGLVYLALGFLVFSESAAGLRLDEAAVAARDLGTYVFRRHWLAIELVSLLLLVPLVAALLLGRPAEEEPR